jgi:hypothetical protein
VNPFASLTQEKTVEAKVSADMLDLCAFGGATTVYRVPTELLKMARRRNVAVSDTAEDSREQESVPPVSLIIAKAVDERFDALPMPRTVGSTATRRTLVRWSIAAASLVALICASYRLMME